MANPVVRPLCSQCDSTHAAADCPHRDVVEYPEIPAVFDCPYDYERFGPEAILVHVRDHHPQLWPALRAIVNGHLQYVDQRYNGPATD